MVSDITTTCHTQVAQGRASHIEFMSIRNIQSISDRVLCLTLVSCEWSTQKKYSTARCFISLTKSLFLGASLKITLYLWILRLQIAKQKNKFQEKRDPWHKAEQQELLLINYKNHSKKINREHQVHRDDNWANIKIPKAFFCQLLDPQFFLSRR